ncbi:TPA: DUF5084 family protein, partial [Staphylococcus aureus]|nr:DUF5084 family protein [Staphylococcus aureus]
FYFVMKARFMEIGIKLYGEPFKMFGIPIFIMAIILFTIGTVFVYKIQQSRLKQ